MRLLHPERDREQIAENRAFVMENMPELLPFIKELHAQGAISGWRNVVEVGPAEDERVCDPHAPAAEDASMQAVIRRQVKNGTYRPIRGR